MKEKIGRSEKRYALFYEALKNAGLRSDIIGLRASGVLIKRSENNSDGVTGTYLSGNGGAVEKAMFLFAKNKENILSYEGGRLEVCVSSKPKCF